MANSQSKTVASQPIRVLLVDDEPDVTRSLKVSLRKTGWRIDTAEFADEAMGLVGQNDYDVVISDERMPGMQGSDLLALVKAQCPSTIRITLSGQASLERAIRAINLAEIHRFLLKPCPPAEVQATVEELLERRDEEKTLNRSLEDDAARERDELTKLFDAALDQMWMCYQPIWNRKEEISGYEALLRTELEMVSSPKHFFEMAERLDRSHELEARVREHVASDIANAPADASIFVNVNPNSLSDPGLYASDAPLSRYADRVVLELTEHSVIGRSDELARSLERLASMGYQVAIDDLGAGYSGLNKFTAVNPSLVKFDMEMIRNLDRSPTKQALVKSMAELCSSMEIVSVAEGIETEQEHVAAKALGCDLFQGFLLGKPGRGFVEGRSNQAA